MLLRVFNDWTGILFKVIASTNGAIVSLILLGICINTVAYRSFRPLILPLPSAEQIGQDYLQAVIQKRSHQVCHQYFITQFGGAQTRNAVVSAEWHSGNSDHEFEVTTVEFDYRHQASQPWKKGQVYLMTASNIEQGSSLRASLPFRRVICGLA